MKVSIIIPAYNEEKYIKATLRALLAQTYHDLEIIVVDNDSTDKTAEKVRQFQGVVLIQEKHPGVQFAREAGRKAATGEILGNLDADCLPGPVWVESGAKYFADPGVVAITGPYRYYDAGLFFRFASWLAQNLLYNALHKIGQAIFHRGAIGVGGNMFIRAEAFEKIGGYDTTIVFYGDDTNTINRLARVGKVLFKNNIAVNSSARRFKNMGVFSVYGKYFINFLWVILFNKPFTKTVNRDT